VRALGLAIRIADNLAVVAYGYKDGLPRAYADNYVEFSATQRVGPPSIGQGSFVPERRA